MTRKHHAALAVIIPLALAGPAARATPTVNDLRPYYQGPEHSLTDPKQESSGEIGLTFVNIDPSGKFELVADGLHYPGKVKKGGIVTINSTVREGSGMSATKVTLVLNARLSVTGAFLTGTIKTKGTFEGHEVFGFYTFDTASITPCGVAGSGARNGLLH